MGRDSSLAATGSEEQEQTRQERDDRQPEMAGDSGAAADAGTVSDHDHRHIQKIKLKLAVLAMNTGGRLDTDVYYGNKQIARRGQPVTPSLVFKLRSFDPLYMQFTNEGVRLLPKN